jgi:hypothetical protein
MDGDQFSDDGILGSSIAEIGEGRRVRLGQFVVAAEPFARGQGTGSMRVADFGPPMHVIGARSGRLLWRLQSAIPSYAPKKLSDVPGLSEKVKDDLKIQAAFARAARQADRIVQGAKQLGLEGAAGGADANVYETDFFARKVRMQTQFRPIDYVWGEIPHMEAPTFELRRQLIEIAFGLAARSGSSGKDPETVALISLPSRRAVYVIRKIDYQPPLIGEYEESGRPRIQQETQYVNQIRALQAWFHVEYVKRRVGWEEEKPSS